jgi:hypothetical protein
MSSIPDDFERDLALVRMVLHERLYEHNPQWQRDRASRLADILEGVAEAPAPVARLLDNLNEEVQGDFVIAFDLAGLLLDNVELVKCSLAGGARQ